MRKHAGAWWLIVLMVPAAFLAVLWARQQLGAWQREQSLRRWQIQIDAARPPAAQRLIAQLAASDSEGLSVLVAAWCDRRPEVADSATREVLGLVERWSQLPPEAAGPRVTELAELLAAHAPHLPAAQQAAARRLAHRLLVWPLDGRHCEMAKLLAHCDQLARLPDAPAEEPRVGLRPLPPASR